MWCEPCNFRQTTWASASHPRPNVPWGMESLGRPVPSTAGKSPGGTQKVLICSGPVARWCPTDHPLVSLVSGSATPGKLKPQVMAAILSRAPIASALGHMQNSPVGLEQGGVASVKPRDTLNAQKMPRPALVCEAVVLVFGRCTGSPASQLFGQPGVPGKPLMLWPVALPYTRRGR